MGHGLDPVDQELRMAFTFFKGLKKKKVTDYVITKDIMFPVMFYSLLKHWLNQ